MRVRTYPIAAVAALLLLMTASPQRASAEPAVGFEVGQRAPEIVGVSVDNKPMKLSGYRGKVVVLDFFGDW